MHSIVIRHLSYLQSNHPNKPSTHLTPCIVMMLLTIFPVCYFPSCNQFLKYLKDFIYLFLEREREGEREGEKHPCVVASHLAPTADLAHNPGMCPDWESNRRPFGSQPTLSLLSYTSQGPITIFITGNLYFWIPSLFSTISPTLLPSGNQQRVLCVYEVLSVLFAHFFCSLDSACKLNHWYFSLSDLLRLA